MPDYADADASVKSKLAVCCLALPETSEEPAWNGHRWMVRRRNFAHLFAVHDPAGDLKTMLIVRSPSEERDVLLAMGHPFFRVGNQKNVGMVLDDDVDWDEVQELVTESYCMHAPKKLVALVDRPSGDER